MKKHNQNSAIRMALRVGCILLAVACVGCEQSSGELAAKASPTSLPGGEDSAAFLDRISAQHTLSENDAMHGILLMLDGEDSAGSFIQRRDRLAEKGIVDDNWSFDANRPVTRGKLAYMIYQSAKIPGGVILTLAGPSQRYCLRELEYNKIMAPGYIFANVTGMEFVAVLTRADEFIRTSKLPDERSEQQSDW